MRYDETATYLSYASQGWGYVTTNYDTPNNHVLHTLLVSWLTGWLGDSPAVIRLPAFLAGCALVPTAAWVGSLVHGRSAGLFASLFVATSPVLVEFSTNARGYGLMSLCVLLAVGIGFELLRGRGWIAWLALAEVGVIGLYTLPTMAIPWLGITLWLAVALYRRTSGPGRIRSLAALAGVNALTVIMVAALYSGIVLNEGLDAIVGNRFVTPEPLVAFVLGTPGHLAGILAHWGRGVPLLIGGFAFAAAVAGLWLVGHGHEWSRLLTATAAGATVVILLARNWGEPRIWLWGLPLLSITAGIGVMEIGARLQRTIARRVRVVTGVGWATIMSAQLLIAQPVRGSVETGAFPEVEELLPAITARYREGDIVFGDFVGVEPLRYYLARWVDEHGAPPPSDLERLWVVLDEGDPARAADVRRRVALLGAPPPENSVPIVTVGEVSVYLLGRPAASPDTMPVGDGAAGSGRPARPGAG